MQQVQIGAGDVVKSFTISVGNQTNSVQEIILSVRDFGSLNDTGGLILEGSKGGYSQKYGLASWLSVSADTVILQPHESKDMLVSVENRASLQPGGHYGAVVASIGNPDQTAVDKVIINQQLVALVLVTKVGGEHYDLHLKSIKHDGNWLHLPQIVTLRFQNPGNVHVIPRGLVELKSPTGRVIATGIINEDSTLILPETFREIPVTLKMVSGSLPVPGLYSISAHYRYEGVSGYANKSVVLRYLDLGMYAVLLLVALGTIVLFKKRSLWLPKLAKKQR
jgi:hypothetical protein